MSRRDPIQDPIGFAIDEQKSGRFEVDDAGREYFYPHPDTLKKLNESFGASFRGGLQVHQERLARVRKREQAFEGHDAPVQGTSDKMSLLPLIKTAGNQIIAWMVNTVTRATPQVTVEPIAPEDIEVIVPNELYGSVPVPISADEFGTTLQYGFEHKLRDRLGWRDIVETLITECVGGKAPVWAKVVYEPEAEMRVERVYKPHLDGTGKPTGGVILDGRRLIRVPGSDSCRIEVLPTDVVVLPKNEYNPQKSQWLLELAPLSQDELMVKDAQGELNLLQGDYELTLDKLETSLIKRDGTPEDRPEAAAYRGELHNTALVWFRYPITYKAQDSELKSRKHVEFVELCGFYHLDAQSFLGIWRNNLDIQKRPYVPFVQRRKPFSIEGWSTTEDMMSIQELVSMIFFLTLENAAVANSTAMAVDPEEEAFEWVEDHEIEPGGLVPIRPDAIKPLPIGRDYRSMMPEVDWLSGFAARLSNVSEFEEGSNIPGRTAAAAIEKIMESGLQQPLLFLQSFDSSCSDLLRMYAEIYKQFNPLGELIPVKTEDAQQLEMLPMRMPIGDVFRNFRFGLTAADELFSKQAEIDYLMLIADLLDKDATQVAQMVGPMVNAQMPKEMADVLHRLIERKQTVIEDIVKQTRRDTKKFVVKDLLEVLEQKREEAQRMLEQQQQMMGQPMPPGGMNAQGQPGAPGGGPGGGPPAGAGGVNPGVGNPGAAPEPALPPMA